MQDSLPAGGLRLYREGVDPLGHDERFQVTSVLLSRAFPDASWAHARRKFYDLHEATGSPIAAEALRRITIVTGYSHHVRAHKSFSISRVTAAEVL
jgi:hypothetical protein